MVGTVPAVARLLGVVARLPQGAVVLPGLDPGLDEADWQALEPAHPQYGLKRLLEAITEYGVEHDIVVLGKGLGNGVPGSAAVGRADMFGKMQ